MHIQLILNMFSAKAKTRKTFGFPRSRARSHGALVACLCFAYQLSKLHAHFCLRVHYITNSAKMKCFLLKGIDSTKMNC